MKLIGLTGLAFSGKDTAALAIKESNDSTDIFAFAGPLKQACGTLFNFTDDQLYHPVIKEEIDSRWKKSPRQILQWLGTDVLRTYIDKDFFILNMAQRIKNSNAEYIIISDVRFDNEAEFIRALGGKIIKIVRPGSETTVHSAHVTEMGISEKLVDAVIQNDTGLEEFQHRVKFVVSTLTTKHSDHSNHSNHFTEE